MAITPDAVTPTTGAPAPTPTDNAPAQAQAPATAPAQPTAVAQAPAQATPTPSSPTTQSGMPGIPTDATAVATAHPTSVLRGALMGILGAAAKVGKGVEAVGKATGAGQSIIRSMDAHKAAETANAGAIAKQGQEAQAAKDAQQRAQDEHIAAGDVHSEAPLRMNILSNQAVGTALSNSLQQENLSQTQIDNRVKNNAEDAQVVQLLKDEGVKVDDEHGAGFDNLGPQHATDITSGKVVALNNGQTGDGHGVVLVHLAQAAKTPLTKDRQVVTDWKVDPKTGAMSEVYSTLPAGTSTVMDILNAKAVAAQRFAEKSQIAAEIQKQVTGAVENKQKQAETQKALAESREKDAAAALERQQINGGGAPAVGPDGKPLPAPKELTDAIAALPASGQQALQGMNPQQQAYWIRASHGYIDPKDFSTSIRKGGLGMTRERADQILTALNPNYSDDLFSTIQKTRQAYSGNGKEGQAIRSFNQFLVHAQELKHVSDSLQRTGSPVINAPLNEVRNKYFGQPGVPELMTAVEAARHEWESFVNNGYVPDKEQNQRAEILMSDNSSPAQIMGVMGVMGHQAIGRMDQLNEGYKTGVNGEDYPNLITPSGRAAANELGLGSLISQYQTGGHFGAGPAQKTVMVGGASYPINPDGTITVKGYNYAPNPDGTGATLIGPVKK